MKKSRKQPVDFKLYMITDGSKCTPGQFEFILKQAVQSGVQAIQLRERGMNALNLLNLARKVKSICLEKNTSLFINDRLDVALAVGAKGVHLTTKSLPANRVREIITDELQIGISTHTLEEINEAEASGCDFALFGPVFETESKKKYGPPQGLKTLETVCHNSRLPVFAVGGINSGNARHCLAAGAFGVAVISALMQSKNITATLDNFRQSLGTL